MEQDITFNGGVNIALKIPKHTYDETVAFYRDTLQLEVKEEPIDSPTISRTHTVKFGPTTLWLDCVNNYTKPEAWLEIQTPNVDGATKYLRSKGVTTKDELEKIPKDKHWITDPSGTVLLLTAPG